MTLRRPPWPVFLMDFAQNPPFECKQLRDTDSQFRVNIRFQQSDENNFWNDVWIKRWKVFLLLLFKLVQLYILFHLHCNTHHIPE